MDKYDSILNGPHSSDILSFRKLEPLPTPNLKSGLPLPNLINNIEAYNKALSAYQKLLRVYQDLQQEGKSEALLPELSESLYSLLGYLDTIEHSLYNWIQLSYKESTPHKRFMFELLGLVQIAHREEIQQLVELDLDPWIFEGKESQAFQEARLLWYSITRRGGTGVFRIAHETADQYPPLEIPPIAHRDLQADLFAALARLISRPQGRKLLQLIHTKGQTGKQVTFTLNANSIALGSLSPLARETDARAFCQWQETHHPFGETNIPTPGTGSGGSVVYVVGLIDSDMVDLAKSGDPLPSPVFIGLGHELVHVAHYQHGIYVPNIHFPGLTDSFNNNLEEFLTILPVHEQEKAVQNYLWVEPKKSELPHFDGKPFTVEDLQRLLTFNKDIPTEDSIRDEHGLGARYSHKSIANPVFYPKAPEDDPSDKKTGITGPRKWAQRVKLFTQEHLTLF